MPERRQFSRIRSRIEADLTDGRVSIVACPTRDLSLQGVFVETEIGLPESTSCTLVLSLAGTHQPLEIRVQARVRRRQPDGMGLEFEKIEGLDSWTHLRNLVLYNSTCPEQILKEEEGKLFHRPLS